MEWLPGAGQSRADGFMVSVFFWTHGRESFGLRMMNIYQALQNHFPADRSRVAIETREGKCWTYAELDGQVGRLANVLISLGLEPGARVAAQTEKSPEALMLYLATIRAGLVYLPLNTAYREAEVAYFLGDAQPGVVVCSSDRRGAVSALVAKLKIPHLLTLDADGTGTLIEEAGVQRESFDTVERQPNDLATLIYTSGTTGRSKGAMLTHGNLISNAEVLHAFWQWSAEDVLLHILPIFHVHGLFVAAQGALMAGARMLWLDKFDIEDVLGLLPRATVFMGVPTHYVRLLSDARFGREVCSHIRLFISGSAPLLLETFETFQHRSGHTILERYGMSETAMLTSNPCDPALGERIGGTVGLPLPGTSVRVVDEAGQPCAPGDIGSIQVKGPNIFSGYWNMPEKTREEFTGDGWFKTGDMGRWGGESNGKKIPDTYVSIVGRSKDLVISGGYNVYPKEIEGVIDALPEVEESAVIGVPHPDFGEAVVAVVVPKNGATPDPKAIQETLKGLIANYKVPKRVHILSELPRNAMGKVQKNALRERFAKLTD